MKIDRKDPPRTFRVGADGAVGIRDMGDIHLEPDEQVTFVTERGARHDFTRKTWGFYATPSVNGRLVDEGFKTALVRNESGRIYVMVVEAACMALFDEYCRLERQVVVRWLDEGA